MNKKILFLFLLALIASCNSVKKHNRQIDQLISVNKLKADVDFTYNKLQKLHPELYWYISKQKLDYKFDSLKTTFTKPLTSFAFYQKITPVINEVRQGHLSVFPISKRYTKKENKEMSKKGQGPFSQFEFMILDGKLHVAKNNSVDSTIAVGSKIISINSEPTEKMLKRYQSYMTSDGYNTTFFKHILARRFSNYFVYENGIKDSLQYQFEFNNAIKTVWIKRKKNEINVKNSKDTIAKKVSKKEKNIKTAAQKANKKFNKIHGYDETTKTFQRSLRFIENDSSIAVLKIKSFSIGDYKAFYKQSFEQLKKNKTTHLILDLRNNPGGRLSEINNLYSFLADSAIAFTDKSEVVSKTSLLNRDYFSKGIATQILQAAAYPLYISYMYLNVKKKNGKFYFATSESRLMKLQENRFKGKLYVLIDGGSFSASSIISSNLKGSGRATFVGEETGGAFNGTVAGQMPNITLPNTKIKVRVGLMKIAAHYKTEEIGRGIRPDIEIVPTLEDKIKGKDPEMDWILNDINQKISHVK